jgi:hypothetical protein
MTCLDKQSSHNFTVRLVQGAAERPDEDFHEKQNKPAINKCFFSKLFKTRNKSLVIKEKEEEAFLWLTKNRFFGTSETCFVVQRARLFGTPKITKVIFDGRGRNQFACRLLQA